MTSSTAHKILAVALGALVGLDLADKLPEPASGGGLGGTGRTPPDRRPRHQAAAVTGAESQAVREELSHVEGVMDYWTAERMAAAKPITSMLEGALILPLADEVMPTGGGSSTRPPLATSGLCWPADGLGTRTTGKVYLAVFVLALPLNEGPRGGRVTLTPCWGRGGAKDGRGTGPSCPLPCRKRPQTAVFQLILSRVILLCLRAQASHVVTCDLCWGWAPSGSRSAPVQDRVGSQRIAFDSWTEDRCGAKIHSPYRGRYLHYCRVYAFGYPASGRTKPDTGGTTANGVRCAMTQGSSGGPWFTGFDPRTGRGTTIDSGVWAVI
uniref:Thermostable alkaline serine protease n=1 Tax=Nocardiopsis sp. Mit-7 TaxID=1752115 RepID=A0A6G7NPD8_9ACTN|nr:thermostable alkaline serine protease [Nocardiopsis sp. Mit-7]